MSQALRITTVPCVGSAPIAGQRGAEETGTSAFGADAGATFTARPKAQLLP